MYVGLGLWALYQLAPLRLLRCLGRYQKTALQGNRVAPEGLPELTYDAVLEVTRTSSVKVAVLLGPWLAATVSSDCI